MFTTTVKAGPAALRYADGAPACHSARQDKASRNGASRRVIRTVWVDALILAGLSDGIKAKCAATGAWLRFGPGEDNRTGLIDFGHFHADTMGGAYCGCNAYPIAGEVNRANGDAQQDVSGWSVAEHAAYAQAFATVRARSLSAAKRARL